MVEQIPPPPAAEASPVKAKSYKDINYKSSKYGSAKSESLKQKTPEAQVTKAEEKVTEIKKDGITEKLEFPESQAKSFKKIDSIKNSSDYAKYSKPSANKDYSAGDFTKSGIMSMDEYAEKQKAKKEAIATKEQQTNDNLDQIEAKISGYQRNIKLAEYSDISNLNSLLSDLDAIATDKLSDETKGRIIELKSQAASTIKQIEDETINKWQALHKSVTQKTNTPNYSTIHRLL